MYRNKNLKSYALLNCEATMLHCDPHSKTTAKFWQPNRFCTTMHKSGEYSIVLSAFVPFFSFSTLARSHCRRAITPKHRCLCLQSFILYLCNCKPVMFRLDSRNVSRINKTDVFQAKLEWSIIFSEKLSAWTSSNCNFLTHFF